MIAALRSALNATARAQSCAARLAFEPNRQYTIQRSQIIAAEFERSGLGKLQIELTMTLLGNQLKVRTITSVPRMSMNPRLGVVNEHCQVHGISNLYIAGSSVFPTSGLSNPTLTIMLWPSGFLTRLKSVWVILPGQQGLEATSTGENSSFRGS